MQHISILEQFKLIQLSLWTNVECANLTLIRVSAPGYSFSSRASHRWSNFVTTGSSKSTIWNPDTFAPPYWILERSPSTKPWNKIDNKNTKTKIQLMTLYLHLCFVQMYVIFHSVPGSDGALNHTAHVTWSQKFCNINPTYTCSRDVLVFVFYHI